MGLDLVVKKEAESSLVRHLARHLTQCHTSSRASPYESSHASSHALARYASTLLSPYAGLYYWNNAEVVTEIKVKLEMDDKETQAEMIVQGLKEDLERMARMMELQVGWLRRPHNVV